MTDILSRNASSGIRPQEFRHTTLWSETVPRPSINEAPMTGAERLASYRATRAAGVPVIRLRCPADRAQLDPNWNDTVAGVVVLQVEYTALLEALLDNQQDSGTEEALRSIVDLDLTELQTIAPPWGFGRA